MSWNGFKNCVLFLQFLEQNIGCVLKHLKPAFPVFMYYIVQKNNMQKLKACKLSNRQQVVNPLCTFWLSDITRQKNVTNDSFEIVAAAL